VNNYLNKSGLYFKSSYKATVYYLFWVIPNGNGPGNPYDAVN
jgi:hypothetical protein